MCQRETLFPGRICFKLIPQSLLSGVYNLNIKKCISFSFNISIAMIDIQRDDRGRACNYGEKRSDNAQFTAFRGMIGISPLPAGRYQCEVSRGTGRAETISQIKGELSALAAVKMKGDGEAGREAILAKEHSGRVILEMSYPRFLDLVKREENEDPKPLYFNPPENRFAEFVECVFDLFLFLLGLLFGPLP